MSEVITPPQTPRGTPTFDTVYALNPNAEVFKLDRTQAERTFVSYDRSPDALSQTSRGIITPANKLVLPQFRNFPIVIVNFNVDLMSGLYENSVSPSEIPARIIHITEQSRIEYTQRNNMSGEYYFVFRNAEVVVDNTEGEMNRGHIDLILYADDPNDLPFASAVAPAVSATRLRF